MMSAINKNPTQLCEVVKLARTTPQKKVKDILKFLIFLCSFVNWP